MRILISPDSFKESLTAFEVCQAISNGIKKVIPNAQIIKIPMADGGEGTIKAVIGTLQGELINTEVMDPLMRPITATYGLKNDTAIIEMATASGLELLSENEKLPFVTTTYGTGQLILDALNMGCKKLIIAIGGSATNDAGTGMLEALGISFLDSNDQSVPKGGGSIGQITKIDMTRINEKLADCEITVACDVTNPLLGEHGATYTFSGQKGADVTTQHALEQNMSSFAQIAEQTTGKKTSHIAGTGAAGGLGFGLITFHDAKIKSGFDIISGLVKLENHVENADLIITGEGQIDAQTQFGKVPAGVARLGKKYNKKVICLAGKKGNDLKPLFDAGMSHIYAITDTEFSVRNAMANASPLLEKLTIKAMKEFIETN